MEAGQGRALKKQRMEAARDQRDLAALETQLAAMAPGHERTALQVQVENKSLRLRQRIASLHLGDLSAERAELAAEQGADK